MSLNQSIIELTDDELALHKSFMQEAYAQADLAQQINEVPVGAVVVFDGKVIGRGHNQPISCCDPSLHAEMVAVREAAKTIGNYRLVNATIYVTLEPCSMCAGLLVHSRIKKLVYATKDDKAGAAGTLLNLVQHPKLNHQIDILEGIMQEECSHQLSAFFKRRRAEKKAIKLAALNNPIEPGK